MSNESNIIQVVGDEAFRTLIMQSLEKDPTEPNFHWPDAIRQFDLAGRHDQTLFDYLFLQSQNAIETSQIICALRANAEIRPIIVVTSHADGPECRELFSSGADDVLWADNLTRQSLRSAMSVARRFEHQRSAARNHRQVLAQLQNSDNYAQLLINHSIDMIIAVDLSLRITEFNRAAEETFGYQRDEVLGSSISMLYARPRTGWPVRMETFKNGFVGIVQNRRKNGEEFTCSLRAAPITDQNGEQIGVMGISREIDPSQEITVQGAATAITNNPNAADTAGAHA